jgi:hypothetical protein
MLEGHRPIGPNQAATNAITRAQMDEQLRYVDPKQLLGQIRDMRDGEGMTLLEFGKRMDATRIVERLLADHVGRPLTLLKEEPHKKESEWEEKLAGYVLPTPDDGYLLFFTNGAIRRGEVDEEANRGRFGRTVNSFSIMCSPAGFDRDDAVNSSRVNRFLEVFAERGMRITHSNESENPNEIAELEHITNATLQKVKQDAAEVISESDTVSEVVFRYAESLLIDEERKRRQNQNPDSNQ